jgi:hypothetical protein
MEAVRVVVKVNKVAVINNQNKFLLRTLRKRNARVYCVGEGDECSLAEASSWPLTSVAAV